MRRSTDKRLTHPLFYFGLLLCGWVSFVHAISLEHEPIQPIVAEANLNHRAVDLGRLLFNDPRLSGNDTIACSSCHVVSVGGVDNKKFSHGFNGKVLEINTPTVLNSSLNFVQFWDGRATNLVEQVAFPIHSKDEMNSSWEQVIRKLSEDDIYRQTFARIYPEGITAENIAHAIGEYQRSLVTPNSRFDQFLQGKADAITNEELQGYLRFKSFGCVSCHQGAGVGGNLFEQIGIVIPYFNQDHPAQKRDFGRFNVTGLDKDRFYFKVPSLRNVELTAPYFHDGSAETLEDAVKLMGRHQLGRKLTEAEIDSIVLFLKTLTGDIEP